MSHQPYARKRLKMGYSQVFAVFNFGQIYVIRVQVVLVKNLLYSYLLFPLEIYVKHF